MGLAVLRQVSVTQQRVCLTHRAGGCVGPKNTMTRRDFLNGILIGSGTPLLGASPPSAAAWDAAYLEVAIRRSLPLATLDRRLRDAARAIGVSTID